ncbi:bifunctional glycogen debranching protein GlgX/4-alpha-glucanotransferase [Desulfosporosinus sp. PR]|uniref:bifunctional glycogen debranching protein GlgX/4-alpha-glucanotransferase n=1 Tax=Candidatus Desulfosporosinus nitrosoreducens TaxID=3401928 RepID=UPI0027E8E5E0|nr:bifunctional glycogen debranching protein GlgX/4-alpha-glucanotransferase [Desulfosporosinus sp. PR]MDQ7093721.1 bifunctional glycogen debranching protein GlgX/4-alpha-glucanotransferase [Desulfosporosinus sp. PR]
MGFSAYHDSHDLAYRSPFGAVPCGQRILFRLEIYSADSVEGCFLRIWERDKEQLIPMIVQTEITGQGTGEETVPGAADGHALQSSEQKILFATEYQAPQDPGLVWYYFRISAGGQEFYYGNNNDCWGGEGRLGEKEPSSYQVTVYDPVEIPAWYQRGIMYQIYVDRFYYAQQNGSPLYSRKNTLWHTNWYDSPVYIKDEKGRVTDWDFFGGNLLGVIEKLPYLKELGISLIYFNPIFEAVSNHKYDTADYQRIDPMYGDEKLFERLVKEAKQYGIAVILDGVFSHTGSDSIYFNRYGTYPGLGAYQSADSSYYKWYQFKPHTQEYKSWWNVEDLPEVNKLEPSYQEFLFSAERGIVPQWMKKGIAGWRLDVADELPDEFIRKLRQTIKTINGEAVLIGEVWEDASNKQSYGKLRQYFWGHELDATMNYPFREIFLRFLLGQAGSNLVHQRVMSLYENYPRENFYGAMNIIGSHDRERILTLLGEAPSEEDLPESGRRTFKLPPQARELAVQRLKLISLIQMTFPGVPCVYYGDEAGVEGYSDPYNRGTYPWGREDKEILAWYKRIIRLRLEYESLQSGDFQSFCPEPDCYGFRRSGKDEEILVLINRHKTQTKEITLPRNWRYSLAQSPLIINLLDGETLSEPKMLTVPSTMGFQGLPDPQMAQCAQGTRGTQDTPNTRTFKLNPLSAQVLLNRYRQFSFPRQDLSRSCGVLMHLSSLPSKLGMGGLGPEAYRFIDCLVDCGQSLWQVLPLNPVGLGGSPYQSDSAFAGNLRLISLENLVQEGLLRADWLETLSGELLMPELFKEICLRQAYDAFLAQIQDEELNKSLPKSNYLSRRNYLNFQKDNREWLEDYALYRALKVYFGDTAWYDWEPGLALRNSDTLAEYSRQLAQEMEFNRFVQYTFYYQWQELRRYALAKQIKLIGDIPLFVAGDSCDVWVNRRFFKLEESGKPAKVAGVPPDYFSKTGQLWGNPVYDWDLLAAEDYIWWKQRIKLALGLFDYVRLDHFRGFEAYWELDAREKTAVNGRWMKGPGKRFFESLAEEFGRLPFIAEDLGIITTEVNVLKRIFGFPGMKVLQFTSIAEMTAGDKDIVYYSGTHDNDTLLGWYRSTIFTNQEEPEDGQGVSEEQSAQQPERRTEKAKKACRKLIEDLYLSEAAWVITPLQDILGLDTEARMNVPGTVAGNWQWKLDEKLLTAEVKDWLRSLAKVSQRLSPGNS